MPGVTRRFALNLDKVMSWEHALRLVGGLIGLHVVLTFWCVIAGALICIFVRPKSIIPSEKTQHVEPRDS